MSAAAARVGEIMAINAAVQAMHDWEVVVMADGHRSVVKRGDRTALEVATQVIAAVTPHIAASVLRDAAEELEHAGLRQAGLVVLRLAAKHEKGASE
jgi:biotin carboxylase